MNLKKHEKNTIFFSFDFCFFFCFVFFFFLNSIRFDIYKRCNKKSIKMYQKNKNIYFVYNRRGAEGVMGWVREQLPPSTPLAPPNNNNHPIKSNNNENGQRQILVTKWKINEKPHQWKNHSWDPILLENIL